MFPPLYFTVQSDFIWSLSSNIYLKEMIHCWLPFLICSTVNIIIFTCIFCYLNVFLDSSALNTSQWLVFWDFTQHIPQEITLFFGIHSGFCYLLSVRNSKCESIKLPTLSWTWHLFAQLLLHPCMYPEGLLHGSPLVDISSLPDDNERGRSLLKLGSYILSLISCLS